MAAYVVVRSQRDDGRAVDAATAAARRTRFAVMTLGARQRITRGAPDQTAFETVRFAAR